MAKNIKSIQRREREREELREQILSAAMNILVSEGYEAVTIRRLANEIEYTPGALYSYFKDKDEIVFALVVRAAQHLNKVFQAQESLPNPLERLWAIGRAYLKFAMEHQEYYDLLPEENDTEEERPIKESLLLGVLYIYLHEAG